MSDSIKEHIRTVRGWPLPEVNFRDISTLFEQPLIFNEVVQDFVEKVDEYDVTKIAGIDARGFVLGGAVAALTGLPLIMVRKKGKLPPETIEQSYKLEYGEGIVEIRKDACKPGDRVLLLDDLIATGGTLGAANKLIEESGAKTALVAAVIDLPELGGSKLLEDQGLDVFYICSFTESE